MDEKDRAKPITTLSTLSNELVTPAQISQMVRDSLYLADEAAQNQAKLITQALDQYFRKFAEEGTSLGPLTLDSSPEVIEAYRQMALHHGQIISESLSPLKEVDPLHNKFVSELLREGYKLWSFSPIHRSKVGNTSRYQRLYHQTRTAPSYYGLLQRDAVGDKPSTPHAHWSIEAYTPIWGEPKLLLGADSRSIDLQTAGTVVTLPGQVHAVANPQGAITFTFLEIIGDPASIQLTQENRPLLGPNDIFPQPVWIQQTKAQGVIK